MYGLVERGGVLMNFGNWQDPQPQEKVNYKIRKDTRGAT
jgi:hypothetical protein